jgi:hypothetical protein
VRGKDDPVCGGLRRELCARRSPTPIPPEHEQLLEALLEGLRGHGVPQGAWLVEIAQARQALAQADSLLRRLAEAIVSQLPPPGG